MTFPAPSRTPGSVNNCGWRNGKMQLANGKTDIAAVVAWLWGPLWAVGLGVLYALSTRCDPANVIPLVTSYLP